MSSATATATPTAPQADAFQSSQYYVQEIPEYKAASQDKQQSEEQDNEKLPETSGDLNCCEYCLLWSCAPFLLLGYINSSDVLGFGQNTINAMYWTKMHQDLDVHEGIRCDGCGQEPLKGIRWKCKHCPDHDICTACKSRGDSPGHLFEQASMTTTNNDNILAGNAAPGRKIESEAGVHWVKCLGCQVYPIRGQLFSCVICPNFDLCEGCNNQRRANPDAHPHRFDFFYMPKASNPPPTSLPQNLSSTNHTNLSGQTYNQSNAHPQQQHQQYQSQPITQAQPVSQEFGVHWTTCLHCKQYPIRGQLFSCVVCSNYDLCENCNNVRRTNWQSHPHRFDYFLMPRACNPPPNVVGGGGPSNQHVHAPQQCSLPPPTTEIPNYLADSTPIRY